MEQKVSLNKLGKQGRQAIILKNRVRRNFGWR